MKRSHDDYMVCPYILLFMFKCSPPLPVSCLRNHFPQRKTEYVYKKASHSKTSFPVVPSNFSMHFFIRGSFHQNHICNCILRCFFMCPSCNSIRAEFEGKICRLALQNAFCSAFFLITVFFLERIMVQSSCCAMQTHTMETSFEIKQITAERHYSALLCMLNIDDYGRCNFVIFTMTLG